ncbi:hypothetical protein GOV09_00630 [Candidatus Woesearchaeota archaeon]|nr:hypothetical protein [Candidatus Woesearchaeota archaeon]
MLDWKKGGIILAVVIVIIVFFFIPKQSSTDPHVADQQTQEDEFDVIPTTVMDPVKGLNTKLSCDTSDEDALAWVEAFITETCKTRCAERGDFCAIVELDIKESDYRLYCPEGTFKKWFIGENLLVDIPSDPTVEDNEIVFPCLPDRQISLGGGGGGSGGAGGDTPPPTNPPPTNPPPDDPPPDNPPPDDPPPDDPPPDDPPPDDPPPPSGEDPGAGFSNPEAGYDI